MCKSSKKRITFLKINARKIELIPKNSNLKNDLKWDTLFNIIYK